MTANNIIKRALRLIGKFESGQTIDATDMQDALMALSQMVFAWRIDGIDLQINDELILTDVLPVDEAYENAIVYNLAVELAPEYGTEARASVAFKADKFKDQVRNDLVEIGEVTFDLPIPESRYDIDAG